jgi:predicted Zn-dependent peptidase
VVASFALCRAPRLAELRHPAEGLPSPEDYRDTYPAKISAVTAGDVQRVAQKYLTCQGYSDRSQGDVT